MLRPYCDKRLLLSTDSQFSIFLVFQEIREGPREIKNLLSYFRVIRYAAQMASQKAQSFKSLETGKKRPLAGEPFKYFNT